MTLYIVLTDALLIFKKIKNYKNQESCYICIGGEIWDL